MKVRALNQFFAFAIALLCAGCASTTTILDPARIGPFYTPQNFAGQQLMPATVRRVLVLPVSAGQLAPVESAVMLDGVVHTALQAANRFEVIAVSREELTRLFGAPEFSSASALPNGFIARLASLYAVDAVLFTDLTVYHAYRPQVIGFRAKLASVRAATLYWTFDEVISATDPKVANSVRRRFLDTEQKPLDLSQTALQSPSRFATYVAEMMCSTLPPR